MTRRALALCLAGLLAAGTAFAECPAAPDHGAALARLHEVLRAAPDEAAARDINNQVWALYADAPDETAQEILDAGMRRRANYDVLGAIAQFDRLVDYCPHYAEGYNQRAFVHYLRQDFPAALTDLDLALARNPDHLGALSGKALTLMALGREAEGQEVLRRALSLNPWLPERHLLKGTPL